ncbi:MAG: hypothetical protein WDN31_04215 [Hyphomicrobium sp.]
MRVVISPDDFAPAPISHPSLFKPSPPDFRMIATPTTFSSQSTDADTGNPFQPDVRRWPERETELDQLKSIAAATAVASDKAAGTRRRAKGDIRQEFCGACQGREGAPLRRHRQDGPRVISWRARFVPLPPLKPHARRKPRSRRDRRPLPYR